uniref:Secreted protein n=1 Tax=Steinernema glaseri TaxID=37863 RepID=A0A1I8A835_9BILA
MLLHCVMFNLTYMSWAMRSKIAIIAKASGSCYFTTCQVLDYFIDSNSLLKWHRIYECAMPSLLLGFFMIHCRLITPHPYAGSSTFQFCEITRGHKCHLILTPSILTPSIDLRLA